MAIEVNRLVAEVKFHKEEAKLHRDDGMIAEAIDELKEAVKLMKETEWEGAEGSAVSEEQRSIAFHLADCLGMLGGNARRLGLLEDALEYFKEGSKYEEDGRYGINSSYNLVNSITLPIESRVKSANEQSKELRRAVGVLEDQVVGPRRTDRWAWADLGECRLLLGDWPGAADAYGRFVELSDGEAVRSAMAVLGSVRDALHDLGDETADVVDRGVKFLEGALSGR